MSQRYGTNNRTMWRHPIAALVGLPWHMNSLDSWVIGSDPVTGGDDRYLAETVVSGVAGTFRFYVTHLSHRSGTEWESARGQQIDFIRNKINSRVQAGELPPIIVGDFNFTAGGGDKDEPNNYNKMARYFYLATKAGIYCYGGQPRSAGIDQIWIGRSS